MLFSNIQKDLGKLRDILTHGERTRLTLLLVLMVTAGLAEACSVIAVPAFLSAASSPNAALQHDLMRDLCTFFSVSSPRTFFISLGVFLLLLLLASNALSGLSIWLQYRFVFGVNHSLSTRLVAKYLQQPYDFFIANNTSNLQNTIQAEIPQFVGQALMPLLVVVQRSVNVTLILSVVTFAAPIATLVSLLAFGLAYRILYAKVRDKLSSIGQKRIEANETKFRALAEAFGSPKLTKLLQADAFFTSEFASGSEVSTRHQATANIISTLPRYGLEALAFSALLIIVLVNATDLTQFGHMIPSIGFFAFAAYKVIPSIQIVFASWARFRFGWPLLNMIHSELQNCREPITAPRNSPSSRPTSIQNESHQQPTGQSTELLIELRHVSFRYPNSAKDSLSDVTVTIPKQGTVGICGASGAGKTTLVDLILGLLSPSDGRIFVDGEPLTAGYCKSWQRQVGYVPQDIFLVDRSVAENIAFGCTSGEVDLVNVKEAARHADIDKFIDSLPDGYWTNVGERGVRLSGGQRQRIGIARALYRGPRLIVLDEATSNVDPETEKVIMSAVQRLAGHKTVIVVAHRINTLQSCQMIYRLEEGQVTEVGSFGDLFSGQSRLTPIHR